MATNGITAPVCAFRTRNEGEVTGGRQLVFFVIAIRRRLRYHQGLALGYNFRSYFRIGKRTRRLLGPACTDRCRWMVQGICIYRPLEPSQRWHSQKDYRYRRLSQWGHIQDSRKYHRHTCPHHCRFQVLCSGLRLRKEHRYNSSHRPSQPFRHCCNSQSGR